MTDKERKTFHALPFDDAGWRKNLGIPDRVGVAAEKGLGFYEQTWRKPAVTIIAQEASSLKGASNQVLPRAQAIVSCRIVPDQDPEKIIRLVHRHLKKLCPPSVRMEVKSGHGAEPYLVSPTGPQAQAALRALKSSFGHEPVLLREGGSIPIVNVFKRILGADALLLGLALPDDNAHSPNEKFDLDCFAKGQMMSVYLWQELTNRKI